MDISNFSSKFLVIYKHDFNTNFFIGFNEAALKMEEADAPATRPASEEQEDAPTTYPAIFKPSFAEIPFTEQVGKHIKNVV